MKPTQAAIVSGEDRQPDLFDVKTDLLLPPRLEVKGAVHGNAVQGFAFLAHKRRVRLSAYEKRGVSGHLAYDANEAAFFISPKETGASVPTGSILVRPDASQATALCEADRQEKGTGTALGP